MTPFKETKTYKKLKDSPKNNTPNKFIIHHAGGTNANPLADTSHHTAEMMESWHLSNGWDGLGYHFVIHKNGDIWRGRPEHRSGAHTVNHNAQSIGICLAGNFDATYPTKEQEIAFKQLYQYLVGIYGKLPIKYHRDFANKTCPGKNISATYFATLAEQALAPKVEIVDGTPEAAEFCKRESALARKGLIDLIIKFLESLR